jgi:tRNA pseudouridine65 synthase
VPAETEPVTILRRDDRLLVAFKPSGRLVHRTALSRGGPREPFLLQSVAAAVGRPVHAIHRLDRGTSGAVLFALDPEAARAAQAALAAASTRKHYLVLARGSAADTFGSDRPLRDDHGEPQPCRTEFRCVARRPEAGPDGMSLLVARIHTGRRHQIRRHLNHLGHHVAGDTTHGKGHVNRALRDGHGLTRLGLHAAHLGFDHPLAPGRWDVIAPVPPDLAAVLASLDLPPGIPDPVWPTG